jgi:hypothetical protein
MSATDDRIQRNIRDAHDAEAGRYTYRVHWSDKEGQFVGTCVGFPGLAYKAGTRAEARTGIQDQVRHLLERISRSL